MSTRVSLPTHRPARRLIEVVWDLNWPAGPPSSRVHIDRSCRVKFPRSLA